MQELIVGMCPMYRHCGRKQGRKRLVRSFAAPKREAVKTTNHSVGVHYFGGKNNDRNELFRSFKIRSTRLILFYYTILVRTRTPSDRTSELLKKVKDYSRYGHQQEHAHGTHLVNLEHEYPARRVRKHDGSPSTYPPSLLHSPSFLRKVALRPRGRRCP